MTRTLTRKRKEVVTARRWNRPRRYVRSAADESDVARVDAARSPAIAKARQPAAEHVDKEASELLAEQAVDEEVDSGVESQ